MLNSEICNVIAKSALGLGTIDNKIPVFSGLVLFHIGLD